MDTSGDLFGYEDPNHTYTTFVCMGCGHTIRIPVRCGNRFCRICSVNRRNRISDRVKYLLERVTLDIGHSFKFLTLTIPNMENPKDQLKMLQKSFRRFRQRVWWKGLVKGGCSFYEVKIGTDGKYHIHLHAIIESAYLDHRIISEQWSQVSPGRIVDIRMIHKPQIINYVTKYTTKSDLPLFDQFEASSILKGSRLFQPFGTWHSISKEFKPEPCRCNKCGTSTWAFMNDDQTFSEVVDQNTMDLPVEKIRGKKIPDNQLHIDLLISQWYKCNTGYYERSVNLADLNIQQE